MSVQALLRTREFGTTGIRITTVGFGAWAIGGGDWPFGWGAQEDANSIAAIRHALDQGINWIDTAAVYGLGHSEEVVRNARWFAQALRAAPACGLSTAAVLDDQTRCRWG